VFTSVYYLVLLILAFFGLVEWMKRAGKRNDVLLPAKGIKIS
jgi:hypothetical protein